MQDVVGNLGRHPLGMEVMDTFEDPGGDALASLIVVSGVLYISHLKAL